jgi:hypothetical protein
MDALVGHLLVRAAAAAAAAARTSSNKRNPNRLISTKSRGAGVRRPPEDAGLQKCMRSLSPRGDRTCSVRVHVHSILSSFILRSALDASAFCIHMLCIHTTYINYLTVCFKCVDAPKNPSPRVQYSLFAAQTYLILTQCVDDPLALLCVSRSPPSPSHALTARSSARPTNLPTLGVQAPRMGPARPLCCRSRALPWRASQFRTVRVYATSPRWTRPGPVAAAAPIALRNRRPWRSSWIGARHGVGDTGRRPRSGNRTNINEPER